MERAREERQLIFERYERGRSDMQNIDRWEDPSFEVYHQMDTCVELHHFQVYSMTNVAFVSLILVLVLDSCTTTACQRPNHHRTTAK